MALKTTVQCAIHSRVGFANIDNTYEVDGDTRAAHVALYDAQGNFISLDEYNTCQFSALTPNTNYILRSVYMDAYATEVEGVIPDTEVTFKTKTTDFYRPMLAVESNGNVLVYLSDEAYNDSIWMPSSQGFNGFGIGFELCDASGNVIETSLDNEATFTAQTSYAYVRTIYWTGKQSESSRVKSNVLANTDMQIAKLSVFAYPNSTSAEVHVRLENFPEMEELLVFLNNMYDKRYEQTEGIENGVHVINIDELESDTTYKVIVSVNSYGNDFFVDCDFDTTPETELPTYEREEARFKDFWIAVGEPGAYSKSMVYDKPFGVNERFGIKIKHSPYSPMPKIKNVVVQSWKDENGDDVWLPRKTGSQTGTYEPAITHESVDFHPKFVIFGSTEKVNSNDAIRRFIQAIQGRWLKVWDEYTQMGYEGVYLEDVDDDPKFKRRNYDYVEFELKFKVNGDNLDAPFDGIGE